MLKLLADRVKLRGGGRFEQLGYLTATMMRYCYERRMLALTSTENRCVVPEKPRNLNLKGFGFRRHTLVLLPNPLPPLQALLGVL